jgi:diguanylate cyclase (GGDEF)-like protein
MDMQVDTLWEQATRSAGPFSLLMVDVDNFKRYNDHYGHLAGDECLRAVASCIDRCVHQANEDRTASGAFAARYGGEEFAVVIPDVPAGIHAGLAARLVEAVCALGIPHEQNADYGVVTISVGGACLDPAAGQIKTLFRQADDRLYKAKGAGRNRAEVC